MSRKFIRDISRMNCSIFDIKAWYEGESYELKKYLGFGFYNTIFLVISNYPEYANNFMIRRLERVRRNTETFSQNLSEKLKWKDESSENYVFFRGEIINKPFIEFINENDFEIIK